MRPSGGPGGTGGAAAVPGALGRCLVGPRLGRFRGEGEAVLLWPP